MSNPILVQIGDLVREATAEEAEAIKQTETDRIQLPKQSHETPSAD